MTTSAAQSRTIIALLAVPALYVLGYILQLAGVVLLPFVVAVVLAFVFRPIVLTLERKRIPRAVALLLVVALAAGLVLLLAALIRPSIDSFTKNLPQYQERVATLAGNLSSWVQETGASLGIDPGDLDPSRAIAKADVGGLLQGAVLQLVSSVSSFFLTFLFMLFLLAGTGTMATKIKRAFPEERAGRISQVIANIDHQVRQYLVTKTIINLIIGVVTAVILLILGIDFAVVWGLLAFLLSYIPNIGSAIATVFPVVIALVQFDTPTRAIIALVSLIVSQNVVGNVLEPKMMQFSLNLSPVLILVMLILWNALWGVWGMVLAVPLTAIIKIICENIEPLRPIAVLMSGNPGKEKPVKG